MRQYLRLDPNLPDHKEKYPDGALATFSLVLCFGEHQPNRGRFRNRHVLAALLGKRTRWIAFLLKEKDLIEQEHGVLYIDGWDEWQEGDWKVAERMKRVRERKKQARADTPRDTVPVTPADTVSVTVADTNPNVSGLSERLAVGGRRKAVGGKASDVTVPPVDKPTPADAIANGQTDDPVLKLGVGMHDLLGHALSGQDAIACQAALNQYAYMDADALLQRARDHVAHCKKQQPPLPVPRTVAGFGTTWREQNDWLADHGEPKAWRPSRTPAGLTRVGDMLPTTAVQRDPDE